MQKFTQKIVQMMKDEKLFESQGGPIILSQVLFLGFPNTSICGISYITCQKFVVLYYVSQDKIKKNEYSGRKS